MRQRIQQWHGGQLMIAWVVLGVAGIAVVAGWFAMIGTSGHADWPNRDRAACLRSTVPRLITRANYERIRAGLDSISYMDQDKKLEIVQQIRGPGADSMWWVSKGYKYFGGTPSSDTTWMMNDLVRFETYDASLDTLIQDGYLSVRGLRLDRNCVRARYSAVDQHLAIVNWASGVLLLVVPFFGLWMTWVWLSGKRNPT